MTVDQSVQVEQLHKIFKLLGSPSDEYWKKSKLPHATIFKPQHQYKRCFADTFKDFPPSALTLLDTLLAIEPENRGTAASALESEVSFDFIDITIHVRCHILFLFGTFSVTNFHCFYYFQKFVSLQMLRNLRDDVY